MSLGASGIAFPPGSRSPRPSWKPTTNSRWLFVAPDASVYLMSAASPVFVPTMPVLVNVPSSDAPVFGSVHVAPFGSIIRPPHRPWWRWPLRSPKSVRLAVRPAELGLTYHEYVIDPPGATVWS